MLACNLRNWVSGKGGRGRNEGKEWKDEKRVGCGELLVWCGQKYIPFMDGFGATLEESTLWSSDMEGSDCGVCKNVFKDECGV